MLVPIVRAVPPLHPPRAFGAPTATRVLTVIALALATAYAVAIVRSGGDALLVLPPVGAVVVVAALAHPAIGLYMLFGASILFEQFTIEGGIVPITSQARFFTNVNAYTPIPVRLSAADLLMVLTLAALVIQRLRATDQRLRLGAFGWAVLAYAGIFVIGAAIGIARGGAWNADVALAEVRAPFQLGMTYFLAANLVRDVRQLTVFLWLFVLAAAVKAVQTILNYHDASNLPYTLRTFISHEDVVFIGVGIGLAVVAVLLGLRTRLARVLLALQPLFLAADMVANRRVGLIALAVALIAITLLGLVAHPWRAALLVLTASVVLAVYAVIFWDSEGPAAEPLRAVRSVVDSSATSLVDQNSSAWRDIEHHNIGFTMRQVPLTGVGVGQHYLFEREPDEVVGFPYWRFITHDALLWLWLKAGPLGAWALWFLVARVLLVGASAFRRAGDPSLRLVIALPVILIVTQVVFSSVDLGLTYSRTMVVLGASLGLLAFLAERQAHGEAAPS
jgi:hypothetical protein